MLGDFLWTLWCAKLQSSEPYPVLLEDFCTAFPHHFCFDRELRLEHVGIHIHSYYRG